MHRIPSDDDFTIRDSESGETVVIDCHIPDHAWGVTVPKKSFGQFCEKLHDHINKGDNNG